jgi:Protein of unknown function (DUF1214)
MPETRKESPEALRAAVADEWQQFCEKLKTAGEILLRPETPVTDLDRAEGLRYLGRLTRLGLQLCFEHADPDFPVFLNAWNETTKAGSDNPDNLYLNATVRGNREYRVRGHRGSAPSLRFSTFADRYATEGIMAQTGSLRAKDMTFAADGTFEVVVSQEPRPGNWLSLAADSSLLTVRQNFADRKRATAAIVSIEQVNGPATPRPLTLKRAQGSLKGALAFLARVTDRYAEWAQWFQARPNTLHIQQQTPFHEEGGDPKTQYMHGYWSIGADEVLVLDTPVPLCDMWNFQLSNYWMESLDYRHYPVCINKPRAKYNPDGSVTLVVGAQDPGFGNFLDTAGHTSGMMILRWTGAQNHPVPAARVVKV